MFKSVNAGGGHTCFTYIALSDVDTDTDININIQFNQLKCIGLDADGQASVPNQYKSYTTTETVVHAG